MRNTVLLLMLTAGLTISGPLQAGTIDVPGEFATIQAAAAAATPGDTIRISEGTYEENIEIRTGPLTLIGVDGPEKTVVDGNSAGSVCHVEAPGKVTVFFVVMMAIQALVGIVAQPFIMGVCAAGKTEWEGRIGIVGGKASSRPSRKS